MLSDQGGEFLNQTVLELTMLSGMEHRVSSPYHPRTNGLTEIQRDPGSDGSDE